MEIYITLVAVGLLYFGAKGLSILFVKTQIPDVLVLMVLGIILGPITGLLLTQSFGAVGRVLSIITLAVILFESGTSLNIFTLGKGFTRILIITLLTFVFTVSVVAGFSYLFFGLSPLVAVLTGAILGGTSSAVVIPMVKSLQPSEETSIILSIESALTDVLCIVLTLALLQSINASGEVSIGLISKDILLTFMGSIFLGASAGVIWAHLRSRLGVIDASDFANLAFALMLYGIMELVGLSGAIASMSMGLALANYPQFSKLKHIKALTESEKGLYSEIVFLLKTFFFIYLGLSIIAPGLRSLIATILILFSVFLFRFFIAKYALSKKATQRDAILLTALVPKGLAAAVLAELPYTMGIDPNAEIRNLAYTMVLFSIIMSATLILIKDRKFMTKIVNAWFSRYQS